MKLLRQAHASSGRNGPQKAVEELVQVGCRRSPKVTVDEAGQWETSDPRFKAEGLPERAEHRFTSMGRRMLLPPADPEQMERFFEDSKREYRCSWTTRPGRRT